MSFGYREITSLRPTLRGSKPPRVVYDDDIRENFAQLHNGQAMVESQRNYVEYVSARQFTELALETREVIVDEYQILLPIPNGTVGNIISYAQKLFGNDQEQQNTFVCFTAAFVFSLCKSIVRNDPPCRPASTKMKTQATELASYFRKTRLVCLLSGVGGTGKSFVIKAVVGYSKRLCSRLNVEFNNRSIVVSALTGTAAVSIRGETVHSAARLLATNITAEDIASYANTYMIFVDEISFAPEKLIRELDLKLRILKDEDRIPFGGLHVVFAGDFSQLEPVNGIHCIMGRQWSKPNSKASAI